MMSALVSLHIDEQTAAPRVIEPDDGVRPAVLQYHLHGQVGANLGIFLCDSVSAMRLAEAAREAAEILADHERRAEQGG